MTKKSDKPARPKVSIPSKAVQAKLAEAEANKHKTKAFPTLTMRQTFILVECMKLGLAEGVYVDGKFVSADEWLELMKELLK